MNTKNKSYKLGRILLLSLLLMIGYRVSGQYNPLARYANLLDELTIRGRIPVIVALNVPFEPNARRIGAAAFQNQQAQITSARQAVALTPGVNVLGRSNQWDIPSVALSVDRAGLEALAANPLVKGIAEDRPMYPLLAESTNMIDAPEVWAQGYDGTGQTVVILDDGIESTHPFFGGRVVAEACFSYNDPTGTLYGEGPIFGFCPNGLDMQTGPGSAALTRCQSYGLECAHGTLVSGVAAGSDGPGGQPFSGVAPNANIIAITIFVYRQDAPPSPRPVTYTRFVLDALDYIYDTLRFNYDIAAINMSFAFTRYNDQIACDTELAFVDIKAYADLLRAEGIASVSASANDFRGDGITAPGCISSIVAAGGVADNNRVVAYSNMNFMVDLLTPSGSPYTGTLITTSYPGGLYRGAYGTSVAAPHVTGAYALLKQAKPDATVGEILYALQQTGVPVTDNIRDWGKRCGVNGNLPCSGLTYPRIDLDAALLRLGQPFQNRFTTSAVTLSWNRVSWANGYEVQADNNSDFLTPEFTGNTFSNSDLDIVTDPLANDLYYWRVRGVNGSTQGSWSPAQMFVVNAP
jgi:subtilisin family serine protease